MIEKMKSNIEHSPLYMVIMPNIKRKTTNEYENYCTVTESRIR